MKKLFLFLLGFAVTGFTSFAQLTLEQVPTPADFISPQNTGANQTVGINSTVFDDYAGDQIGAFFDLDEDGDLECVGLETIGTGFFGLALWGDDSSTNDVKDGLGSGDIPYFFINDNGTVLVVEEMPEFTGYVTNAVSLISDGSIHLPEDFFKVLGCMDSLAENYNEEAEEDDGSCYYFPGCTNDDYAEYYTQGFSADFNDGSCLTFAIFGSDDPSCFNFNPNTNVVETCVPKVFGCMEQWADNYNFQANVPDPNDPCDRLGCTSDWADNYDNLATTDDGSCDRLGCMAEWADNYDDLATTDDGSCDRLGCMSDWADNYDDLATTDDGSCDRLGCMSDWADNYDGLATTDDGSCDRLGCMFDWADNTDPLATTDDGSCTLLACTDPNADNHDSNATDDDGSCYREGCMVDYMDNYDELATQDTEANSKPCYRVGCMDEAYFEYDELATRDNFGDQCVTIIVDGCYNPIAENYDPAANNGDQEALCIVSQIDPSVVTVTSNNMSVLFPASNVSIFDESSDLEAGDIVFAVYETSRLEAEAIGYSAVNGIASAGSAVWTGETVGIAVFGSDGLENNGYYEAEPLVWLIAHDGVIYNAEVTYNDVNTSNSVGQYSEGGYISVSSIHKGSRFYEGCMNPTYYNFNPLATSDDGTCESLISFGCADTTYVNYAGCDLDTTNIDVNANNYGNAYGENVVFNINTELFDGPSGVCAEFNAQELCQDELEGCTDPMALNYNPKATVNKETICNWSFTPDGEDPTMAAYEVDSDGNITDVNYNFGGVDPSNVNDGFVGSDFHYAQKFTAEGPDQVFSPTDHVIDALAQVLEWIEVDEHDDSLLYEFTLDSAATAFAEDEAADEALLAYTLDSAATAFAADEAADEALLAFTLDSASVAHDEYSHMRDNQFDDMFNQLSDSISSTLDSAAVAFAADEAADEALLAQTIADYETLLANTLDSAAAAFAADEAADEALLAQTIADAEALLAYTLDSAAVAFAADEAADELLQSLTLDSLNYHRDPIEIDLKDGWNTIGYYLRHSSYATHQFESQFPGPGGVEAAINIVKDNVGNFWWPDFQFDGLGELIPGEGYQVRVKDGGAKSDFIFDHSINREDTEYRNLDPTVPQWAIDMPVDVHPNDVRTLIRVVNMLGQEVVPQDQFKGEVLLYLYNDGTVEKKIVQ